MRKISAARRCPLPIYLQTLRTHICGNPAIYPFFVVHFLSSMPFICISSSQDIHTLWGIFTGAKMRERLRKLSAGLPGSAKRRDYAKGKANIFDLNPPGISPTILPAATTRPLAGYPLCPAKGRYQQASSSDIIHHSERGCASWSNCWMIGEDCG